MMLVTLDQAKAQVEQDQDGDDALLIGYIHAASAAVLDYLKLPQEHYADSSGEVPVDSDGPVGVPYQYQQAVLLLVAEWYRNRDAEQNGEVPTQWGYGYLPRPVIALLYPHRDPTLR